MRITTGLSVNDYCFFLLPPTAPFSTPSIKAFIYSICLDNRGLTNEVRGTISLSPSEVTCSSRSCNGVMTSVLGFGVWRSLGSRSFVVVYDNL